MHAAGVRGPRHRCVCALDINLRILLLPGHARVQDATRDTDTRTKLVVLVTTGGLIGSEAPLRQFDCMHAKQNKIDNTRHMQH
jgi:hypothetical protein